LTEELGKSRARGEEKSEGVKDKTIGERIGDGPAGALRGQRGPIFAKQEENRAEQSAGKTRPKKGRISFFFLKEADQERQKIKDEGQKPDDEGEEKSRRLPWEKEGKALVALEDTGIRAVPDRSGQTRQEKE